MVGSAVAERQLERLEAHGTAQQLVAEADPPHGLSTDERVVTTGFANLSDGAKVIIGKAEQTPTADLAPRKKGSRATPGKDGQGKDGQAKDGQGKDGQGKDGQSERRGKKSERSQAEGDRKGQTGPAAGDQSGNRAKSQP